MKALGDFLANIYWIVLAVAAAPILIGFVLRKIAGKHAPTHYETATQAELDAAEQRRERLKSEENWLRANGVID
jgi:hypothetical protein